MTLLAYSLASSVYVLTGLLLLAGVYLILFGWPFLVPILIGLLCLWFAWLVRPRFSKLPTSLIKRNEFPKLYSLVDQLAAEAGTRVDAIHLNIGFSGMACILTARRMRILSISVPLWTILSGPEKIACLAREAARLDRGDPFWGVFIQGAVSCLEDWYDILRPPQFAGWLVRIFHTLFASLPQVMINLLHRLLYRERHRSQYLADFFAARQAGTMAILGLLRKQQYAQLFRITAARFALSWTNQGNVFDQFKTDLENTPPAEFERLRRIDELVNLNLDANIPPTRWRIEFLNSHHVGTPAFTITPDLIAAVDTELAAVLPALQEIIRQEYAHSC